MLARLIGQMVAAIAIVNMIGPAVPSAMAASSRDAAVRIVVLGDSLTAGFGVESGKAFPDQLARLLKAADHNVEIVNAGVSGDTTAGGLARLDWSVPEGTDAVIVELGANDMLRGLPPAQARLNLDAILTRLKSRGIEILLAGMRASRSLGEPYANAFDRLYPELAEAHDILLYPFFLSGVALDPNLNQPDGLHPTAEGAAVIARKMQADVEALIVRVQKRRTAAGRG